MKKEYYLLSLVNERSDEPEGFFVAESFEDALQKVMVYLSTYDSDCPNINSKKSYDGFFIYLYEPDGDFEIYTFSLKKIYNLEEL